LSDLSNDFSRIVVGNDIVPEFLCLSRIKLAVLVSIVIGEDPLGVLLHLDLNFAGSIDNRTDIRTGRPSVVISGVIAICVAISLVSSKREGCIWRNLETGHGGEEGVAALRNSEVAGEKVSVFLDTTFVELNVGSLGAVVVLLVNDGQVSGSEPNPSVLSGVLHAVEGLSAGVVRVRNNTLVLGELIKSGPERVNS